MRILHTYCLNYNLGDHALGLGVKALLRNFLPVDLIAETNLQGTTFDDAFIKTVNDNYDLLVIGGGGIIHGRHWPNGWFWLIERERIKDLRIPFVVYGAGYNYFRGEQGIPERGINHLRETAARASFFSVRNDGSRGRLAAQTGIEAREVPDPGFAVGLGRTYERPVADPYVLVQLAADKPEYRYGGVDGVTTFTENIRRVVEQLAGNRRVILAPHVLADVGLCHSVAEGIRNATVWPFGSFAFDRTVEAVSYYKFADFVLAMRGHGQIIPLSFEVPVITLANHDKNRGLVVELGLDDLCIDIGESHFVVRCMELCEQVDAFEGEIKKKIGVVNEELWAATRDSMHDLRDAVVGAGTE